MPHYNSLNKQKFQVFLSEYTLDSFGESFLRAYPMNISLDSTDVPKDSPIQLDTTALSYFFWGMEYHYGSSKPVDILFHIKKLENFKIRGTDDTLSTDGDIGIDFFVHTSNTTKEKAISISVDKVALNFTANLVGNSSDLRFNFKNAGIRDVIINNITFGEDK